MDIGYGQQRLDLDISATDRVAVQRPPMAAALADPGEAVRAALERPFGYPALRRAVTPDDHVAVVVDEKLPHLAQLLTPILEHLQSVSVQADAITLVCRPSASQQQWLDDLPDEFQEVRVEVHNPHERKRLAYLATTKQGRRLYLNRTVVDADQVVVLTGRRYDPLLGYAGGEGGLFPVLSDAATRQELAARPTLAPPGSVPWPLRQEAAEASWLLGAPFFVQVIEGAGDELAHVVTGATEALAEGQRLLDARWRLSVAQEADTVVAAISGDPARHDFGDLARALACAARAVRTGGRIVLLTDAAPDLGPAGPVLRQAEEAAQVLKQLRSLPLLDPAAFLWASAAQKARVYLLSRIAADIVEELFATPLDDAGQVQRLLAADRSLLVLPDAHKALAVVAAD
jgi:nickel-dependent lactate racemase